MISQITSHEKSTQTRLRVVERISQNRQLFCDWL